MTIKFSSGRKVEITVISICFSGDIELVKSVAVWLRMTGFFVSLLNTLTSEYIPQSDEDQALLLVDFLCKITENLLPLFVVNFVLNFISNKTARPVVKLCVQHFA